MSKKKLYLKVEGTVEEYKFYYSSDGKNYTFLSGIDTKYLSSETTGSFTGVFIALFAEGQRTSVDFGNFVYVGIN